MCFINKNMECLKENRDLIYYSVKEIIDRLEYDFSQFDVLKTKNGEKALQIANGNKKIRVNSIYAPKREAEHWADKYNFDNIDVPIIMFGLANGVFAREMLLRAGKESAVIIVEPDLSLFVFCLYEFDMTDIISDSRVVILIDKINIETLQDVIITKVGIEALGTQIVCIHPKMDEIYCEKLADFVNAVKKNIITNDANFNTAVLMEGSALDNTFKNLHFIKESNHVSEIEEIVPKDIPVIIVAAGPSLDKNVVELKNAVGRAFILATDRSVKTLIKNDVHYDAIITIDPAKSAKFMDDPKCFDSPIFVSIESKNEILEMNNGRKIWLTYSRFFIKLYMKYGVKMKFLSVGGSVATAAFNVARTIGSKTIILVGQDLAYDGEYSHAGGVSGRSEYNECDEYIEDIYGNKVKTKRDWMFYLDWFETAIKKMDSSIEVIDATEGGARIVGTKIMKLSEAIQRYCIYEFDFRAKIKDLKPTFNDEKYLEIKQDLVNLKNELNIIDECADKGIKASDNILEKIKDLSENDIVDDEIEYSKLVKDMNDVIERQLVYEIIERDIIKDVTLVMRRVNMVTNDKKADLKKSAEISKFVYEKILDSSRKMMPKLCKALEDM